MYVDLSLVPTLSESHGERSDEHDWLSQRKSSMGRPRSPQSAGNFRVRINKVRDDCFLQRSIVPILTVLIYAVKIMILTWFESIKAPSEATCRCSNH